MFKILKEGERLSIVITAGILATLLGDAFKKGDTFTFAAGSDNGGTIGLDQQAADGEQRFTVIARQPGYAAVTIAISNAKGEVVGVFGQQYYVVGLEQPEPVSGDLGEAIASEAPASGITGAQTVAGAGAIDAGKNADKSRTVGEASSGTTQERKT